MDVPRFADPVQLRLLELGFALSGQTLHLLGCPPHHPPGGDAATPPLADPAPQLHAFAQRISGVLAKVGAAPPATLRTAELPELPELQELQELQARARSLVLLLYGDKKHEAQRYAALLAESQARLRGRLAKARWVWLGLWLAAQSVLALARVGCGDDPRPLLGELQAVDEPARRELLDALAPQLALGRGPWPEVAAFLRGEGTALLGWADQAMRRAARPAPRAPLEAELLDALALLNPCYALYYAPRIPDRKRTNASQSCAADPRERIAALLDCTVFGSAKDAVLFGSDHLYCNHSMGSGVQPFRVAYRDLAVRPLAAEQHGVQLGPGRHLCLIGSAVSGDRMLAVLQRVGELVQKRVRSPDLGA
jgi:hypothetical protein